MRAAQSARQDLDAAEAQALKRLEQRPGDPKASETLGLIRLEQRRFEEAIEYFRPALDADPENAVLLNLMGTAYAGKALYKSAVIYFQQAAQAAPNDIVAWENLGKATYRLKRWSHAKAAFTHCLALDPSNAEAGAGLARLALNAKEYARAIELATDVLEHHPDHLMAREVLAEANLNLGHYEAALKGAQAITQLPHRRPKINVLAHGVAARAAEELGQYDVAFDEYGAMNEAVAEAYSRGFERAQERESNAKLRGIMELGPELAARSKDWRSEVEVVPTIYYIGFVNSGMSLFTDIMLRHPLLVDGRGRPQVPEWEELVWAKDAVARVAALTFEDTENLRRGFLDTFEEVGLEVRPGQRMFDPRPFYSRVMTTLALILPDVHYVMGHRDPRDVVLECFKHRSSPNVSMYEFLTIEKSAYYYDMAMETAMNARRDYGLEMVELGYDELVADPEGQTRRILDAVGLPWDDALYGEGGKPMSLGPVKPSGEWRKYEAQLAPVMPILHKWVKHFGYD